MYLNKEGLWSNVALFGGSLRAPVMEKPFHEEVEALESIRISIITGRYYVSQTYCVGEILANKAPISSV